MKTTMMVNFSLTMMVIDPHLHIHITLSRGEKEARTIAKESKSRARWEVERKKLEQ